MMKRTTKMKRITTLALAGCMGLSLMTACSSSENEATTDVNYSEKKVLRVGMECAYAPFNWTQETAEVANGDTALPIYGQNSYGYGYDVMMAKKIAEELGWEVEIHKVEWDSIGLGLDSGEYDCIIGGMSKNADREKSYDFTDVYYDRELALTVRADSEYASYTSLDQFAGKNITITTQVATAYIDYIDDVPDSTPTDAFYATTSECFQAVANGVCDACIIDKPTSESALLTNKDLVIVPLEGGFDAGDSANVCIAVRKGDTELRELIDGAMDSMGWDKAQMDEMMSEAISVQPAAQ